MPFSSEEEVKRAVCDFVEASRAGYSVAINAEKMFRARSNEQLRMVIEHATFPVADGFMAVLALRLIRGLHVIKVDFPRCVFESADHGRWRVALCGGSADVNAAAVDEVSRRYPGIRIVGATDGYQDVADIATVIRESRAQVAFLAMGTPKQELLASSWTSDMPGVLLVGCGGAFDVLAGKVSRAPKFFVDYGLEWLYRLGQNPSRFRRQLALPQCLLRVIAEAIAVRFLGRPGVS